MSKKNIIVQLIYRSYRTIHPIYQSILDYPPENTIYLVPKVNNKLQKIRSIYKKNRDKKLIKYIAAEIDKFFFSSKSNTTADLIHYISVVENRMEKIPKNFVIEIEHAMALTKMDYDPNKIDYIRQYLNSDKCKSIICLSQAASRSLGKMLGAVEYSKVSDKVEIVYPSSRIYDLAETDHTIIPKSNTIKLLFVGNDCIRKGLHELLIAFSKLPKSIRDKFDLYVVSDDAEQIISMFELNNVYLYPAKFSRHEVIRKFFLPADIFVFPTKHDTFGMVIIDALAASTPVIATDQFAIPEIIQNNKNGMLLEIGYSVLNEKIVPTNEDRKSTESINIVDGKLVDSLEKILKRISTDREFIKKLQKNTNSLLQPGNQLSIEVRNKKLRRIYENAIK